MKALVALFLIVALVLVSGCIGQASPSAPSGDDLASDVSDIDSVDKDIQPEDMDFSVDFG